MKDLPLAPWGFLPPVSACTLCPLLWSREGTQNRFVGCTGGGEQKSLRWQDGYLALHWIQATVLLQTGQILSSPIPKSLVVVTATRNFCNGLGKLDIEVTQDFWPTQLKRRSTGFQPRSGCCQLSSLSFLSSSCSRSGNKQYSMPVILKRKLIDFHGFTLRMT